VSASRLLIEDCEIGSLEVGKLADVALWRVHDLLHTGISDPFAALVFSPAASCCLWAAGRGERRVEDCRRSGDLQRDSWHEPPALRES
jgi:hypothetical protein